MREVRQFEERRDLSKQLYSLCSIVTVLSQISELQDQMSAAEVKLTVPQDQDSSEQSMLSVPNYYNPRPHRYRESRYHKYRQDSYK